MKRLTDRKTAAALRSNAEGLRAKGFEPDISDLRYIKLAEYEDAEEDKSILYLCDPEKNTRCTKETCYLNGGECMQISNIKFRR